MTIPAHPEYSSLPFVASNTSFAENCENSESMQTTAINKSELHVNSSDTDQKMFEFYKRQMMKPQAGQAKPTGQLN